MNDLVWVVLYHAALLELNPQRLAERIEEADKAIAARQQALASRSDGALELRAIADAERNLTVLRKQLSTPALDAASHTHPELSGEYVAVVNTDRQYLAVTDGVCRLLGHDRAKLLGMRIEEITAPELHEDVPETFEQFTKQGTQAGYFTLIARNGQRIPIRYEARVFPDGCLVSRWDPL